MALALTLHVSQGFWIGDRRWFVESFDDNGVWLIGPEREGTPQRVRITEKESFEIESNVFASEGFIPELGCRVLLDAPREITILRDELYRRGQNASHDNPSKIKR